MRHRPLRCTLLLLSLATLVPSVCWAASSGLPQAVGVFLDAAGTTKVGTLQPGESISVYVVTDSLTSPDMQGWRSVQLAVDVDPRLLITGRVMGTGALGFQAAPEEWLLGFDPCIALNRHPFVLLRYQLLLPPGVSDTADLRIGLRDLEVYGEPMRVGLCADSAWILPLHEAGGVVLNPSSPTVVHLSGSPQVLVEGRDLHLAWETARTTRVLLDGVEVDPTGRWMGRPTIDATWTLVAEGDGQPAQAQWSVSVIREPRIVSFTAELVPSGSRFVAKLGWEVEGADWVELEGVGEVHPIAGALLSLPEVLAWTLRAGNEWGTSSQMATAVGEDELPPIILSFTADPNPFEPGEAVILGYEILFAETASISPEPGPVDPAGGVVAIHPTTSGSYLLSASNANGTTEATIDLQLRPPSITSFVADPPAVYAGRPTVLRWSTVAAEELTLEPGFGVVPGPSGEFEVTPPADASRYILVARNAVGQVSRFVDVGWLVPHVVLTASDRTPYATEEIVLTAVVEGADIVTLEPGFGAIDPDGGSFPLVVATRTTFVLTGSNAKGTSQVALEIVPQPPTVALTVTPEQFFGGETVELRATIVGATSATLEPGLGTLASGEHLFQLAPLVPTTYVLTATSPAGTSVDSLTLAPLPPAVQLTASTTTPYPDEPIELMAQMEGAITATLEPGFGAIDPAGGSFSTLVPVATTYVLSATNPAGTSAAQVRVLPLTPAIVSFQASPTWVSLGGSVTLSWSVTHADQITLEPGGFTDLPASGSMLVVPEPPSTTWTLTASNSAGASQAQRTVTVGAFSILSFTATPRTILSGEPVTLAWEVAGGADVSIDGIGPVEMVGSLEVFPTASRSYVLRATDGTRTETKSVWVTVGSPPPEGLRWSWSPYSLDETPPPLDTFVPFELWALALSPEDGLLGYEFSVAMTPCISVIEAEPLPEGALNVGGLNNWIVGTGLCLHESIVPLVRYRLMVSDPDCLDYGVLAFGAASPSSLDPPAPAYLTCTAEPRIRLLEPGPPLEFRDSGVPTPALHIDLSVEVTAEGTELDWTLPDAVAPRRAWVLRRCLDGPPQMVLELKEPLACSQRSWVDHDRPANECHRYRVVADIPGGTIVSDEVFAEAAIPSSLGRTHLRPNVPNPFNPSTELRFTLSEPGDVTLRIYDVVGRLVKTLHRTGLPAGDGAIEWTGLDERGHAVASGVYVVQLSSEGGTDTRRVTLVK